MTKRTKVQQIKLFIKISIVVVVLGIFIVLGFFIKPVPSFENSNLKKWANLSEIQKISTVEHIVKDASNQDLLIQCINKISELSGAGEMQIRDATALCYNGIKINSIKDEEQDSDKNDKK